MTNTQKYRNRQSNAHPIAPRRVASLTPAGRSFLLSVTPEHSPAARDLSR